MLIQPAIDFQYEVSFYYINDILEYALYAPDKNRRWELKKYSFTKEDKQFAQKFIFKIREYLDFCKSGMNRKVGCTFVNCLYN